MLMKHALAKAVRLGLSLTVCAGTQLAWAEPDVLDRTALTYNRAASSVLMAVTRAGERLIASGERGIILLSDDNGKSWRQAKVPVSVGITNLYFPSAKNGWAVGHSGVVLNTTDGGETWSKQLDGKQAAAAALSAAQTSGNANVIAEAQRLVDDGPDKPFLGVHFSDDQHGMIIGAYGMAFTTADAGKTWVSVQSRLPNPKGKHLYKIVTRGEEMVIAGEQGGVYWSTDRGQTFRETPPPYPGTFLDAIMLDSQSVLVFGLRGNAFATTDQGKTWRKVEVGTPNTLTAGIRLADGTLVLLDETGRVLRSTDGGHRFSRIPFAQSSSLTGIAEGKDKTLILSGTRGVVPLALPSTTK